jgi:MFS family permease
VPGLVAVGLTFFLKDKGAERIERPKVSFFDFFRYYQSAPRSYRTTVAGLLLFTLFNSSDVFLLLIMKQRGFSDQQVIGVYIFYNLVYAAASYPMGKLGDTLGLRRTFIGGLILFIVVYAGAAVTTDLRIYLGLFFLYGLYAAMTEGISKAWISNLCEPKDTATAIGTYTAFSSVATMLASLIAGLVWQLTTPAMTFLLAAAGGGFSLVYFLFWRPKPAEAR